MAWHGYIKMVFSGAFGGGAAGVKEADQTGVKKGMDTLVTDAGKTRVKPEHALQMRWSIKPDRCIVEAQFKNEPDKAAILLALLPEIGIDLNAVLSFEIFGGGKDDWEASRIACLAAINAEPDVWNTPLK